MCGIYKPRRSKFFFIKYLLNKNEPTVTALPVSNWLVETPVREDVNALTMSVSFGGGDPMKEMINFTVALLSLDRLAVSRVIPMKFAATELSRNNLSNCKESQHASINDDIFI